MLPLNLLLLPLLGGFVFVSRWHVTRFVILRTEGYRLLFHCAVAGLSCLFLAALIIFALGNVPPRLTLLRETALLIDRLWHEVAPVPFSGTAVLALLIGCISWKPLNYLVLHREDQIDLVISRKGDALEVLARRAMGGAKPVVLTLKNDQVHVGYITTNFNPAMQTEYLLLLPVLSGHTSDSSRDATYTKYYGESYERARSIAKDHPSLNDSLIPKTEALQRIETQTGLRDFEIVIPIEEVRSASIFVQL